MARSIKNNVDHLVNTDFSNQDYKDMAGYQDLTKFKDSWVVEDETLDGISDKDEISWTNPNFSTWLGYYMNVPEYGAAIDKFVTWIMGRGYEANKKVDKAVSRVRGSGNDDFLTVLENQIKVALIAGDSFAEIVRDFAGRLTNIKPLNPSTIKIIVKNGIITRYEQTTPVKGHKIKFKPKEIFHLSWNKIADSIHGNPMARRVEKVLKSRQEGEQDLRVVFHRYVKPINFITAATDDDSELNSIQTKIDNAYKKTENILVPKDTIEKIDRMSLPQGSTLDPLPWLKFLVRNFVTSIGMPEVIMGWGEGVTEASGKVIYMAFQQTIERMQDWIEAGLKIQMKIELELIFPETISEEIQEDDKKDGKKIKLNPPEAGKDD